MKDHKLAINVGTIGHVDHGRTTLSAALVRLLEKEMIEVVPFEPSMEPCISIPIHCYDHEEAASAVIRPNNTPKGPRVKRGKGNRYR